MNGGEDKNVLKLTNWFILYDELWLSGRKMVYVYCTLNYSTFKTVIGVLGRDWPYLFLKSYKKWIPTFNILDWEVEAFPSKSRTLLERMSMKKKERTKNVFFYLLQQFLCQNFSSLTLHEEEKKVRLTICTFRNF